MVEFTHQRRLVVVFHLLAAVLLGLHIFVRSLPPTAEPIPASDDAETAWWGLWPATYPPAWSLVLGVGLLLFVMAWLWWRELTKPLAADVVNRSEPARQWTLTAILIAISVSLVAAFVAFPIVHTRWGDAYVLAKSIAWPDPALLLTHSWQAPLDLLIHSRLWLALNEARGWQGDATPVYRLLSPLAGALYLLVVLLLARDDRLAPAWLTYGLLASLGLIQLFFGYVENYSFAAVGVLAYLWLGIGVLRGTRPLWLAASALALTHAIHPSTIALSPSLLYLAWRVFVQNRDRDHVGAATAVLLQIALPMIVVAAATIGIMEGGGHGLSALTSHDRPGGGDARLLVPIWETTTRWEHYTLFSWPHLRDFLNEQLLVAPVVLPGLSILAIYFWIDRQSLTSTQRPNSPINRFLLLATLLYLLFTWLWNPDYGGQRDWDLFSLAVLPETLLLISLLPMALTHRWYLFMGAVPLILVQSLHTAAWIYQNTLSWSWP